MVHRETGGVGFQLQPGPLESEALKLSLFDREPERERESTEEREREEIEESRSLFRLEPVREAEWAPSLSHS